MITGYIGPNGSGKTLSAVTDCIHWADKLSREVYSTTPIEWQRRVSRGKYETRQSLPIESLDHLMDLDSVEILLDEVAASFSSRETNVLPPKMILALQTLRHRDVGVYWTAPSWESADVQIRRVTQDIHVFRPAMRTYVEGQRWFRTRVSVRKTYDGTDNAGSRLPKSTRGLPRMVLLSRLRGFGTYKSRNPDMQRVQGAGKYCVKCGGERPKLELPKCECVES